MKRFFQLMGQYAKMNALMFLRDGKTLLLQVFADNLSNLASVGSVFLLAWRFDGAGDMNRYEVLLMLGYVTTVTGLFHTFCDGANVGHISRVIGRGQLDHFLLAPIPIPLNLITGGFYPIDGCPNLIIGGIIIGVAVKHLQLAVSVWWVLLLLGNLVLSLAILLCQSYILSSLAFYAPVACEEISSTVIGMGFNLSQYPLSGMPKAVRWPLLTLIPTGLLGWLPTMTLLKKPPFALAAYFPILIALLLFAIAQSIFRKGWKHYAQVGANRYLPFGHR